MLDPWSFDHSGSPMRAVPRAFKVGEIGYDLFHLSEIQCISDHSGLSACFSGASDFDFIEEKRLMFLFLKMG
jgi:hypothetical protein